MAALAAATILAWWYSRPAPPYHLPAPVGARTLQRSLAIELVIDESGSNSTSDPHNLRVSESAEVIRWLGRYGRPTDRIGTVQFSGRPVTTLALTPVKKAAVLARNATAPDPRIAGGGTNIASALERGVANLAMAPSKSKRVLILFTDGASDTQGSIAPVLAKATGIDVYMIALDADGTYDRSRGFWESLGLRGITRIDTASRGRVARSFANDVLRETGQHLPK